MKKFPTVKDYVYWMFGLVIIILYLLTLKITENSEVVDYISFAATLISILLAIIAIVYAYQQGNQSSENHTDTKSILSAIVEHVNGIGQLKTDVAISNEGIKDVKSMTDKLNHLFNSEITFKNQSDDEVKELFDSKVNELRKELDFQIICVPSEFDFKNPKKINLEKNVFDYVTYYRKMSGDDLAVAFNMEESSTGFGISFNLGTLDKSMTPERMKNILESYDNKELKIFTVARLIYASFTYK